MESLRECQQERPGVQMQALPVARLVVAATRSTLKLPARCMAQAPPLPPPAVRPGLLPPPHLQCWNLSEDIGTGLGSPWVCSSDMQCHALARNLKLTQ